VIRFTIPNPLLQRRTDKLLGPISEICQELSDLERHRTQASGNNR